MSEEVPVLLDILRESQKGIDESLVVCLEEVGDYSPWAKEELGALARNGRHDHIAVIYVTQAAVEVPKAARRQMSRIVSFSQSDPADIDALQSLCGGEFANTVQHWEHGDEPAIWTIPSLRKRKKATNEAYHVDQEQSGEGAPRGVPPGPSGGAVRLSDDRESQSEGPGTEGHQPEERLKIAK